MNGQDGKIALLGCIVFILSPIAAFAQSNQANSPQLQLSAPMLETGLRIFGTRTETPRITQEVVQFSDHSMPFLGKMLINRQLVQVVVTDVSVELKCAQLVLRDNQIRTFDILIDPSSNSVLRIASRWPEEFPPLPPDPGSSEAAKQIEHLTGERYHGFPTGQPSMTFLEALAVLKLDAADPFGARQIVGEYVLWSRMNSTPKPVWAITLKGIPFTSSVTEPKEGDPQTAVMRYIVDPETRKWIFGSNVPHPVGSTVEESVNP